MSSDMYINDAYQRRLLTVYSIEEELSVLTCSLLSLFWNIDKFGLFFFTQIDRKKEGHARTHIILIRTSKFPYKKREKAQIQYS